MTYSSIQFRKLSLSFPHKICFQDFSAHLQYGQHIALVGRNGSGKSSLLKMLQRDLQPSEGEIFISDDVCLASVPQIIEDFESLQVGGGLVVGFCAFWSVLTWQCPCSVPDFGMKSLLFAFLF